MLKVLLVSKDDNLVRFLVNSVIVNNNDLKISGITNSLSEANNLLLKHKPDLVITSSKTFSNNIKEKYILHTPKIILISKSIKSCLVSKGILYINPDISYRKINILINEFIKKYLSNSKKDIVTNLLLDLGFDFKVAGTGFLLDAILYTHTYEGIHSSETLKSDIYAHVAKTNNTSIKRVTWSVTRSVLYMYKKHTKETYKKVEDYFKIEYPEKPTPKQIINIIANNLDA